MNRNKWQSRRWLICVWAITMVTIITFWQMVNPAAVDWIGSTIGLLLGIIGGYIASDTVTKPKGASNDNA